MSMLERFNTWRLVVVLLLGVSTTACQLTPSALVPRLNGSSATDSTDQLPPDTTQDAGTGSTLQLSGNPGASATPASGAAAALGSGQVAVTTGSIEQTFNAIGRVAGAGEATVSYPGTGKVDAVAVRAGDKVEAGQLLLQTDATQLQKDLTAARARLDTDSARVEQAQEQLQSQARTYQADATRRAADDAAHRQQAVADAQVALRKAQDNMATVQAGPSTTDVRTAQAAVANAQALLDKATADRDKLLNGADPADVRAAQRVLAAAQTDVDKAQADLDKLTKGPDPVAVATAQREVERSQTALQVAKATKVDGKDVTQTQKDALVTNAQLNVQDAQDRLNQLKQPPSANDVAIAQRNLQVAKDAAAAAQQQLDNVRQGPSQATIDAADQAVDNAQTALDNATDRLTALQSHPTPQELQDAQDRINQAQAALAAAQKPAAAASAPDQTADQFNIQLLSKAVDQDQADIDTLQKQLDDTHLLAPFAGVVTAVRVKAGDALDPTHPVVTLSRGGAPIIAIDMTDQDAANVKVGQPAHVKMDGSEAAIDAKVIDVAANEAAGVGRTATLQVSWPQDKDPPAIGATGQVSVVVLHKDNVLLVPKKAVRSAGSRKFVQYLVGSSRKVANVEVGIVSDTMVEIVSGLSEGQIVAVGP